MESRPSARLSLEEKSDEPVRVLVQTKTHLVPGEDHHAKWHFMVNRIALHHWGSEFTDEDRCNEYGTQFAYKNRRCFFLVDHGTSPIGSDDPFHVPIVQYEWTGEAFKPIPGSLPADIREKISEYPFKPEYKPVAQPTGIPPWEKKTPEQRRKAIRRRLEDLAEIPGYDHQFLEDNPEHMEWLQENVEQRLLDSLEESRKERQRSIALGIRTTIVSRDGKEIDIT